MTEIDNIPKQAITKEFARIKEGEQPKLTPYCDIVWVLSGPQETFEEAGGELGNETRDRLITGFDIMREITALRLNKPRAEITAVDIHYHGPILYFNGTDRMNDALKKTLGRGSFFDDYDIPESKIVTAGNTGIKNTPDQFKTFPAEMADNARKIVLVTDGYHIPRTRRISKRIVIDGQLNPVNFEKLLFYPAKEWFGENNNKVRLPNGLVVSETEKIPQLIKKGFLPEE